MPLVNISRASVSPSTSTGGRAPSVSSSSKVCAPSRSCPGSATTVHDRARHRRVDRLPCGRGHRPDHGRDRRDLRQLALDLRSRAGRVEGARRRAPSPTVARRAMMKYGSLPDRRATRSPGPTPRSSSAGGTPPSAPGAPYVVVRVWLTRRGSVVRVVVEDRCEVHVASGGGRSGKASRPPTPGAAAPGCYPAGRSGHEAVRPVRALRTTHSLSP